MKPRYRATRISQVRKATARKAKTQKRPRDPSSTDSDGQDDGLYDVRANLIVTQMLKYAPLPKKKKKKNNRKAKQARRDIKNAQVSLKRLAPELIEPCLLYTSPSPRDS